MRPFTQQWPRGNHSRLPASTLSSKSQLISKQSMTLPRFFSDESTTYVQEASDQTNQSTSQHDLPNIRAIQINQKIVEHGQIRQWKEILQLHRQQKQLFDPVCYATAICQLGGINSLDRRHLLFLGLLDDLIKQIQVRGMYWMDAGSFGDILHALAKMQLRDNHHAKEMINLIERQTQENPEWFFENGNPENIANFIWACGKLKVHAPNLFRLLDREAQTLFDYGNPQHISTSIWACGRLEIKSPNLFRILDQEAELFLDKCSPKDISNCVWACAELELNTPNLFRMLDLKADLVFVNSDGQAVANCAKAWAALGIESTNLFRLLDREADRLFNSGSAKGLAKCVWACGRLEIYAPNLFTVLDNKAEQLVKTSRAQDIGNCAWACGMIGIQSPNLFRWIDQEAERLFVLGDSHAVANCVWACGKLGIDSANLFSLLNRDAERLFENADLQDIANCVWACGKLGIDITNLFRLLDRKAQHLVNNGTLQDIAKCAWACGTLGIQSPNLFRLLDQEAERLFGDGPLHEIASCMLACAKLNVLPGHLIRLLDQQSNRLVDPGESETIAICAFSLSKFGYSSPPFFSAVDRNLDAFVADANNHSLITFCGAMAVLDMCSGVHSRMFCEIWNSILRTAEGSTISETDLRAIVYIQTTANLVDIDLPKPPEHLKSQLDQFKLPVFSSMFSNAVSRTLFGMGFSHEQNVSPSESIPAGVLPIDLACVDRMVAVECNGPERWLSVLGKSNTRVEEGLTKAKRRILQSLGWKVINLDRDEALKNGTSKQWLRDRLLKASVEL